MTVIKMNKSYIEWLDYYENATKKDVIQDMMLDINSVKEKNKEIERLNKLLENIDTYIHLWKLDDIGEKTMLILNDILLIKNGMSDEVVRLKEKISNGDIWYCIN